MFRIGAQGRGVVSARAGLLAAKYFSRVGRLLAVCAALAICGCVSQTLNLETAASIDRIALAGPEDPVVYSLSDGLETGVYLGDAFGSGTASVLFLYKKASQDLDSRFTATMASQGLKLGCELREGIERSLSQLGYDVVPVDTAREQPSEMLADYGRLNLDADAVLDVAVQHSTYERRAWGKVGPSLTVTLRLVDLRSGRQLFLRTYRYDFYAATIGYTNLRPPEEFGFEEIEAVLANPKVAVEGFRAAIPMILADLRSEFSRPR